MALSCQLHDLAVLLPRKVGHVKSAGIWSSEPVWMLLRQKSHARVENRKRILCCLAQSFTFILTELSRFPYPSMCALKICFNYTLLYTPSFFFKYFFLSVFSTTIFCVFFCFYLPVTCTTHNTLRCLITGMILARWRDILNSCLLCKFIDYLLKLPLLGPNIVLYALVTNNPPSG